MSNVIRQNAAYADREVSFEYKIATIGDLKPIMSVNEEGKQKLTHVELDGRPAEITQRFMSSICSRYAFGKTIFNYFEPEEVFLRINARKASEPLRLCFEDDVQTGGSRILGVSNPDKPFISYDSIMGILGKQSDAGQVTYADGLVSSMHKPRVDFREMQIAGDLHHTMFNMMSPIDGYGTPNVYLAMLRLVCTNGAIAMSREFRSQLGIGKEMEDVEPSITRALDGFTNDEGFSALKDRLEVASKSWASVFETVQAYKMLVNLHNLATMTTSTGVLPGANRIAGYFEASKDKADFGVAGLSEVSPILKAFTGMTGDVTALYGLANMDALTPKRQKMLPTKCTVYDLIQLLTEVATHYATPLGAAKINGAVGKLIVDDYDLEGSCTKYRDFADFHVSRRLSTQLTGSVGPLAV